MSSPTAVICSSRTWVGFAISQQVNGLKDGAAVRKLSARVGPSHKKIHRAGQAAAHATSAEQKASTVGCARVRVPVAGCSPVSDVMPTIAASVACQKGMSNILWSTVTLPNYRRGRNRSVTASCSATSG